VVKREAAPAGNIDIKYWQYCAMLQIAAGFEGFLSFCSVAVDVLLGRGAASLGGWCPTFRDRYVFSKRRAPITK
jgi:hypothetical protein